MTIKHTQVVHGTFNRGKEDAWDLSVVYGHPNPIHRRELWQQLRLIEDMGVDRWCVGGDFNGTLRWEERTTGSRNHARADREFLWWYKERGLEELEFQGPQFTWVRGSSGSRIDRCLANARWREKYTSASVLHLPRFKSDHCPLLLSLNQRGPRKRKEQQFKFFAPWVTDDGFSEVVRKSWNKKADWRRNVQNFKWDVQRWNKVKFGNINIRKDILLRELEQLQEKDENSFFL